MFVRLAPLTFQLSGRLEARLEDTVLHQRRTIVGHPQSLAGHQGHLEVALLALAPLPLPALLRRTPFALWWQGRRWLRPVPCSPVPEKNRPNGFGRQSLDSRLARHATLCHVRDTVESENRDHILHPQSEVLGPVPWSKAGDSTFVLMPHLTGGSPGAGDGVGGEG